MAKLLDDGSVDRSHGSGCPENARRLPFLFTNLKSGAGGMNLKAWVRRQLETPQESRRTLVTSGGARVRHSQPLAHALTSCPARPDFLRAMREAHWQSNQFGEWRARSTRAPAW